MKILLLEDDPILSDLIYDHLKEAGYETDLCMDAKSALEKIDNDRYDLFIFDINVPYKSGIELLREIRAYQNNTPAIFITAYQDINHLKAGFDAGCDDYIKKPFELEELDERINNIKRHYNLEQDRFLEIDATHKLHLDRREIVTNKGERYAISHKEAQILRYFLNHAGRVISPEELIHNIWEFDETPSDATLRVYIKNLRHYLGKEKIKTVRGLGYSFEP